VRLRADTPYSVLVAVNGTTVTALVNNTNFLTHSFTARLEDGIAQPISKGMIGFGADNSFTRVDNFAVQVLPPNLSYSNIEDFEDGLAQYFSGPAKGDWTISAGKLTGIPAQGDAFGFRLLDLAGDAGLAAGSLALEANSKVKLTADVVADGLGGLVFDFVSEDRFKFAGLDKVNGRIVIGHVEDGEVIRIDASASMSFVAGTEYQLSLLISGSTVAVEVNGAFKLSHSFNAVSVDGQFGVLTAGGTTNFDDVSVATDDASLAVEIGEALVASSLGTGGAELEADDLTAIVGEAIRRRTEQEDLTAEQVSFLNSLTFAIADLEGTALAIQQGSLITFDIDAAGHGYFIDATPEQDEEYDADGNALSGSDAVSDIDLLTVAMHELGHALGFDHLTTGGERDYMSGILDPSQRLGLSSTDTLEEPANSDAPIGSVMVYDDRVQGMISQDEALLLDSVDGVEPLLQSEGKRNKPKNIIWAAE